MPTFLQEKNATANILSRTDGGTANTIRDNAINSVRQNEIANAYPFSFMRTSTSVTTSSGVIDLPANYNITHAPYDVRVVNSGQGDDYIYKVVNRELYDSFGSLDRVCFIDWNSSTSRWRLNATKDETIRVIYNATPAELTADADVDNIPDLDCIAFLAAARFWLSSERDETNHDRFKQLGLKRLQQMIIMDKRSNPPRLTRSSAYRSNMGWNT